MSDYRFYTPRMRAVAASGHSWFYNEEAKKVTRHVLERVRSEGPLASADFKAPDDRRRGSWWDWKPAKRALEMLFDVGQLMVTERRKFQRVYDLTERVLPPDVDQTPPANDEMSRFIIRRALAARGIAREGELRWARRPADAHALRELTDAGEVVPVEIQGLDDGTYYGLAASVEAPGRRTRKPLHILSPFNGLVMGRGRAWSLFGFQSKLECYLPEAKRRYGYFCLPILWGTEFVGRLDPKAERKNGVLRIKKLMFEPDFRDFDRLLPAFAAKLQAFAAFNGCEDIILDAVEPRRIKRTLQGRL
jgi:uncharacterized protein YcaQ